MSVLFPSIPMAVMADSYKAGHFQQYPSAQCMVAYGEFRTGLFNQNDDVRVVVYGMRFIVEKILHHQWTLKELDDAEKFYQTHRAPNYSPYPFPKELFRKFIAENNGYFPIKFEAIPDGSCVHVHVPVYQITAEGCYTPLCTFLETMMTMVWYPSTVATLSRRVRDCIERSFVKTAEHGSDSPLIESRLHDFGCRGCTTVDQAVIGGCAHLLNFTGTDTMAAAYYAQFGLNDGEPIGNSIPATEHSVMTSWETETGAISNMIDRYGDGLFACVMDSYDYIHALEHVLPAIASQKLEKGGFMVIRPDSGDPAEAVVQALKAADRVFGSTKNGKGYRLLKGCGVIQGDGMNLNSVESVLEKVEEAGFSAENCTFGMGGGLLQKINRDTMSFATKLSNIVTSDGRSRDIMKAPKGDSGKSSLPGRLAVKSIDGVPTVYPLESVEPEENLLKVLYDCGPCMETVWESFSELRSRVRREWTTLPKFFDPISKELRSKIDALRGQISTNNASV